MIIKRFLLPCIAILAIFISLPVFGEEYAAGESMASDGSLQSRGPVVHRLSWHPVEYASRYEVIVEVQARTNEWIEITRRTTARETFIDSPLSIGSYRFMVSVYDLLGYLGASSDWLYFEVRSVFPSEEPVIVEQQLIIEQAITEQPIITDEQSDYAERQAALRESDPDPDYQTAQETPAGALPIVPEISLFRMEIIFQPLINLPMGDFNKVYSESFFQPLGVGMRLSLFPFKTGLGYFGIETNPSLHILSNDNFNTSGRTEIINLPVSIVWHSQPFSSNTAIDLRAGGGITYIKHPFDSSHGKEIADIDSQNLSLTAGFSFMYYISSKVFISAGLDYFLIFAGSNSQINYLRPSLAFGWWF